MGIQLRLFCLLVCCELSTVCASRRHFRFGNKSHSRSYNNALRSPRSLQPPGEVFNKVDIDRAQWLDGLALNVSRTFGGNGLVDVRTDIKTGTLDSSLSWIYTLEGKHMEDPGVYQRPRRAARTNQSEPGSISEKLESLLKPSAQKLPTDVPTVSTPHQAAFTTPEEDYWEDSTPIGPIHTRPRGPGLPNPFYPVTGESYAAYAIILVSVIMFTAGIIGNIAIMCAVCHNYYMRSVSNSLLANLALWDFLITFFCLPLVIFHQLTKDWLLGEFSCKIIPYFEVKQ